MRQPSFSVLVHELAHEDLHHGERRNETDKKIRETEAEAVASVVCSAFGVDSTARSSDYISMYRGTTDTLSESLRFIQKTAEKIIDGINAVDMDAAEPCEPSVSVSLAQSPCNHTVHCFGDDGQLQGSWTSSDAGESTRIECEHCGKFYGYVQGQVEATPAALVAACDEQPAGSASHRPG